MESTDRKWYLIARALNDEASSPELDELSVLLQQDESLQQQYELLTRIWKERDTSVEDEENARKTVLKIINRAESEIEITALDTNRRRRNRRRIVIGSLVTALVIISGAWFLINKNALSNSEKQTNHTPEALVVQNGSRSRSLLPDGTTVWLNAGSKLYYENDFTGTTREVRLDGEAFFDVVKQAERPFIVHTSGIDIKVLGTAFNVKSYPEDKTVETTLYRGLVQVVRHEAPEKTAIQLLPNEKLILAKQAAKGAGNLPHIVVSNKVIPVNFTITHIDSTKKENERFETAWLYSRLEFRGDSFDELALKLERWYNVNIVFTDEKAKQLNFNGSFEKETIEQAFKGLQAALPFNYKINNNEISISSSE